MDKDIYHSIILGMSTASNNKKAGLRDCWIYCITLNKIRAELLSLVLPTEKKIIH
jgi:hypothetical protein